YAAWRRRADERFGYLFWTSFPPVLFALLAAAAAGASHGNWFGPGYLGFALVLGAMWNRGFALLAATSATIVLYGFIVPFVPALPPAPGAETLYGWREAAGRAQREVAAFDRRPAVFVVDRYQIAAQLAYYTRNTIPVVLLPCPHPESIWPKIQQFAGADGIAVIDARSRPRVKWSQYFAQVQEREQYRSLPVKSVQQTEPLGNGHAVYVARDHLDGEPALVVFGDTIVKGDLASLVRSRQSMAGVTEVEDPRRLGVVELDADGYVRRIIEKPSDPPSKLAVIGAYLIRDTRAFRRALERMVTEDRRMKGEYWLADAIQMMIDGGERMKTFRVDHWYDCGTVEALLQANRDLLKLAPPAAAAGFSSTVISPSYISPSAVLEGSVVGPYASIGDGG